MSTKGTACPHCGAMLLPRRTVEVMGKTIVASWQECGCAGAVAQREAKASEAAKAAAEKARRARIAALERAGIRPKFYDAKTDREDLVRLVLGGRGLYIQGGCGVGKTHIAMAIAVDAIGRGWGVKVTSAQRITSAIKATFNGEGSEDGVFASLSKPQLLVIDDLGKDAPTEWVVSMLYRVVEERDLACRPVVITSNYAKHQLLDRLTVGGDSTTAQAIVSRLFEMTEKVEIAGEDRRLR